MGEMEHLDIISFDPLNPQLADTYVQSVLTNLSVSKVTTTAESHSEKPLTLIVRLIIHHHEIKDEYQTILSVDGTLNRSKFLINDENEDIIRLTQSTQ